ncbi:MAG: transcriptional regulator NrdR [Burkholderiaceae bacterium]|nr:transcriptional regulator NrdR [Burkholderiaceae bacterium]
MRCPYCGHADTAVVETRASDEGDSIRRRRRCSACDKRFTTYERAELSMPMVVKKNGERVEFSREKLRASMMLALRKRHVSVDLIDAALARIEAQLYSSGASEVSTTGIGELVMRELARLDKVAYVRFASVYREFEDVDAFSRLIQEI